MPKNPTSFVALVAETPTVRHVRLGFPLLGASLGGAFRHALGLPARSLATLSAATLGALLPATASAASSIIELSQTIQRTVYKPLVGVIIGFALLLFVWGIYRYIAKAGDDEGREGAKLMTYGVLVLFVMFTVWGLVAIVMDALGIPGAPSKVNSMPGFDTFPAGNVQNTV